MKRLFRQAVAFAVAAIAFAAATGSSNAATPESRLLATYQPVIHFDPLEQFRPTSVQSFIADSDLERLTAPNTWTVADSSPEPGDLPAPGTGIWRLNHSRVRGARLARELLRGRDASDQPGLRSAAGARHPQPASTSPA
jgi:hypothetical protein